MNTTLILLGKVTGTAALATGALVTGIPATHPADAASTTTKTVHCGHRLGHASAELGSALKAARAKPAGTERRQAVRAVRKDARQGQYGDAAQVAALRNANARLRWRAQAPDALKTALKDARQQPAGDQRKAAYAKVLQEAASGTYGDKIEKIAKKREQRKETCQAQRQQRKQDKKGSTSQS